jgi:hypothetical protein
MSSDILTAFDNNITGINYMIYVFSNIFKNMFKMKRKQDKETNFPDITVQ